MSDYNIRFVLVGKLAGATISLGGHDFVDGVYTFVLYNDKGQASLPSKDDIELKARYMERNYQAFLEGSHEHKDAEARIKVGADEPTEAKADAVVNVEQTAHEQNVTNSQDGPDAVSARAAKTAVREALLKLDPANDDHWTDAGLPSVEAVRELSSNKDVTRADIKALAPKLDRAEAQKVADENAAK